MTNSPHDPGAPSIEPRPGAATRDNAGRALPVVTLALLAACWVMALLTLPGNQDALLVRLYRFGAKENVAIAAGEYWRLLTAAFLHGGVVHLLVNSWSLYVLGTLTERVLGPGRFLATFLVSAVTGSLASWVFNPVIGVGASGAIFGLLGTALYLSWRGQTAHIPPAALRSLGFWTIYNLVYGFITPTIDNAAHLGGLAGGVICAVALTGRVIPGALVGAGLSVLAWGGYAIARTPDITGQVTAFLLAEQADARGDGATAAAELARAPDFPPALATQALTRLREGDKVASLALSDSALALLDGTGPRATAFRRAAEVIGIRAGSLRGRTELFRAWALFGLDRHDEGVTAAIAANTSPDPYDRRRASLLLGQVRVDEGRFGDALPLLRVAAAVEDSGLRAEAHYGLARALSGLDSLDQAIGETDSAITLDPGDLKYARLRTELLGLRDQPRGRAPETARPRAP
jgi:membrane associated rhomboid family serine protease